MTEQMHNRPYHKLDNGVGFHVFSDNPDEIVKYGDTWFQWNIVDGVGWRNTVSMSTDAGQTWYKADSCWSLYWQMNNNGAGWYDAKNFPAHAPIMEARERFNRERRNRIAREKREALKLLSPEEREQYIRERRTAWIERRERGQERRAKMTVRIMNQMLDLGPDLVRLREDIDHILSLMAQGGIDRPFPYYVSRMRYLRTASWSLKDIRRHIKNSHDRKRNP